MMLTMAGCTASGTSLLGELKQVATWEAQDTAGTFDFEFTNGEGKDATKVGITAECKGYTNTKALQAECTFTVKQIQYNGATIDLTKGAYKLSPITMYMDGMKFYVSTTPIKEIAKMLGEDISSVEALKADYVAIDMTAEGKAAGIDLTKIDEIYAQGFKIYENSKIELEVKQDGRKYAIELNADQIVDKYIEFLTEVMNNPLTVSTYKQLGLTDEQIAEQTKQVAEIFKGVAGELKTYIKGSTAKVNYTFTDDSYTSVMELNGAYDISGEKGKLVIKCTSSAKKAAAKAVVIPTNAKVYTMAEIEKLAESELMMPEEPQATAAPVTK